MGQGGLKALTAQERPHEQAGSEPAIALGPAFVTGASVSWLPAAVGGGMISERQAAWGAASPRP